MTLLIVMVALIFGSLGLCLVISTIGWWATLAIRCEFKIKQAELSEQQKLNAIVLEEKRDAIAERRMRAIENPYRT